MEREYNVGTWLTPSDEYIKDIKDTLVEKGVVDESTPDSELGEKIKKITTLKIMLDTTKSTSRFFQVNQDLSSVDLSSLISYNDTENVTDMSYMFASPNNRDQNNIIDVPLLNTSNVTNMMRMFDYAKKIKTIPLYDTLNVTNMGYMFSNCESLTSIPQLDTSNVTDMQSMFSNCKSLTSIPLFDTSNVTNMQSMFYGCTLLISIPKLDMIKNGAFSSIFNNCTNLTNLNVLNIKGNLTIGSGTSWGHLLTLDSLVNTCKECIKQSSSRTLTVGTANLAKLADVYVRFVDINQTTIAVGEKGEVEVCEADNNGAMTIQEYMALKSWTLA